LRLRIAVPQTITKQTCPGDRLFWAVLFWKTSRHKSAQLRQFKTLPARARDQRVRFRVVEELLLLRVPAELAAEFASDVQQVANADRAVADLDVGIRLRAGLDALEPVLNVGS